MQNLFGFIIHPMELGLVALALAVGSAGIGIILFTVLVRLVLSPLQIAQLRNAKAMQRVQPLLAEIRKKHGQDRQKMSEETMRLYREHKVNPAMGCLPTLLQFPILIGLFYALMHLGSAPLGYPHAIEWAKITCNGQHIGSWAAWFKECYSVNGSSNTAHVWHLFHANFLWLNHGLGLPDPYYILPALAGITQWIQSRMMLTRSTDPQQQMMNTMMNFMPLMIVFFALRYASGLSLYWVTSTTIGILIQYRITGLGLLPETLAQVFSFFRGGGTPNTRRSSVARPPSGARALTSSSTSAPTEGPTQLNSSNGNGSNGDGAAPKTPPAIQRRKANRAKGGRGGRRG